MSKYFYWFMIVSSGILAAINLHNNEQLKAIYEVIVFMGSFICLEIKGRNER